MKHILLAILAILPLALHSQEEALQIPPLPASLLSTSEKVITLQQLQQLAPKAKVTKKINDTYTSFTLTWENTSIKLNVDKNYDQAINTKGLLGFLSQYPVEERATPHAKKFLQTIPSIKNTYGLILPTGFDEQGITTQFLTRLAAHTRGYLICNDGFYDPQGFLIIGPPHTQPYLGPAGKSIILLENKPDLKKLLTGTWKLEALMRETTPDFTLLLLINAKQTYQPDGSASAQGDLNLQYIPAGEENGFTATGTATFTSKWQIKDQLIHEETLTQKITDTKADVPELKDLLLEIFAETENEKDTPAGSSPGTQTPSSYKTPKAKASTSASHSRAKNKTTQRRQHHNQNEAHRALVIAQGSLGACLMKLARPALGSCCFFYPIPGVATLRLATRGLRYGTPLGFAPEGSEKDRGERKKAG